MNNTLKWLVGFAGIFFLVLVSGSGYACSQYNSMVTMETVIKIQHKDNQNIHHNYRMKLLESVQIQQRYAADFEQVVRTAIEGRYGKNGAGAVWQWIKEQNPTLDSKMYERIQRTIEAGRGDFEQGQRELLAKNEVYEARLLRFPGNVVAGLFGFPKPVCDDDVCISFFKKYGIITGKATADAFRAGEESPVELYGEK